MEALASGKERIFVKWGFGTPVHLLTLMAAAGLLWGLYRILRRRTMQTRIRVLGVLSLWGVAAVVYNLLRWGSPLEYLPLHLCSVNALVLPVAVLTRNRRLGNLLLLWCLGALGALVVNAGMAQTTLLSWTFLFFYLPHVLEFGIPVLMVKLGLVQRDARCIGSTLGITVALYTLVHICNKALNTYLAGTGSSIRVNYMFSIRPDNPVLAAAYGLIPAEYWYLYLFLPLIGAYLWLLYLPHKRHIPRTA